MSHFRPLGIGSFHIAALAALALTLPALAADKGPVGWERREVDLRVSGGGSIRAINQPRDGPAMLAREGRGKGRPLGRKLVLPEKAARQNAALQAQAEQAPGAWAMVIDSPPIDGFVPWIAVTVTNRKLGAYETDAVISPGVVGVPWVTGSYTIGLYDTGAGATVMSNAGATEMGIFAGGGNTGATTVINGVTGSVDAWVSKPLGVFIDGLDAINPTTLTLNTADMVGQYNVSIVLGMAVPAGGADLPTAIGSPMAAYYAAHIRNDLTRSVVRGGQTYTGPDINFLDKFDPALPEYANVVPLELRPLGSVSVQYVPCIDFFGSCTGGDGAPQSPSVLIGTSAQSLFFLGSVDLRDRRYSALDKTRFMLDTGAQVTVVGSRVAARLGLDPAKPEFTVEIQGVDGQVLPKPGFYLDEIEIPALGEWLTFTHVPVVLLDVGSPEGGTMDGIIGMNLMLNHNLVLRGGGLAGEPDPTLELELITPASVDADFDNDGDVDVSDFGHLQGCMSGPELPQLGAGCQDATFDADSDVDQADLELFLGCSSGPSVPAPPGCSG